MQCAHYGQHSSNEQSESGDHDSSAPEELHRFCAEAKIEPYDEQIANTRQHPAESGVLRNAGSPGKELDVDLCHRKPALVRNYNKEAMPVVTKRNVFQHFAAKRLHRIEIAHRNVEQK